MKLQSLALLSLLGPFACDSASGEAYEDGYVTEDLPMGHCESGDGEPCGAGSADGAAAVDEPCDGTNQCGDGLTCAAPFAGGEPGPLLCRSTCIELEDAASWCSDDAACCNGTCSPRGLCLTGADSTTTGLDGPDSADSDAGTGSSGETTGDSETTSGNGSSGGGASSTSG